MCQFEHKSQRQRSQNSPKTPGQNEIYVAGEKEYLKEQEIRKKGIPINSELRKNLEIMIKDLNIDMNLN